MCKVCLYVCVCVCMYVCLYVMCVYMYNNYYMYINDYVPGVDIYERSKCNITNQAEHTSIKPEIRHL